MQLCQQSGELEQHLVAMDTIVDLIDQLELVDVEIEHGVLRALLLGVAQGATHLVEEGCPVYQLGQCVVVAGETQGLLYVLQCLVEAFVDDGELVRRGGGLHPAA